MPILVVIGSQRRNRWERVFYQNSPAWIKLKTRHVQNLPFIGKCLNLNVYRRFWKNSGNLAYGITFQLKKFI